MKTKVLIIAFLIASLLAAFTLNSNAQCCSMQIVGSGHLAQDSTLIADETNLTYSKTGAKIVCDNESVFNKLLKTHGTLFRQFTCAWKTDRYGRYKHYIIYLSKGDAETIINWAKTNL